MTNRANGKSAFVLIVLVLFSTIARSQSAQQWKDVSSSIVFAAERYSTPAAFRTMETNVQLLRDLFKAAPQETFGGEKKAGLVVSIPMPDGSSQEFSVFETRVMAPGLAARYPRIKTYVAKGITDPYAHARFDFNQFGFHAMILSPRGHVFIDPVSHSSDAYYIAYFKKDLTASTDFVCELNDENLPPHHRTGSHYAERSSGEELRTYRLALACTGEYADKKGGTVEGALSGMVTTVNRVTGVYELELGIRMELIENDTLLIFLNSATDPYSNNNGGAMLDQNQEAIDDIIGNDNYDIGHVFSTGGGGIANLAAVCRDPFKAEGVTGLSNPVGDAFDIDYVAHEMGHQFGGNHTFNATSGSCGGGNRNAGTAFEPGSGSTIMAYAGICGSSNDLQTHSDPYFHSASFDEILDYTVLDFGNNCPVITETGNTPPDVSTGTDYSIPISTPFRLQATATDADGDALTYMWEEMDKGPSGNWDNPSGQAPCFRSLEADTVNYRIFPKMSTIVTNYPASVKGEVLPDYARSLNFRFIARDNVIGGGGVTYGDDQVKLTVVNTGTPFKVTFPNTLINWPINTAQAVNWDVSSTDVAPISCASVNILLSIDGGFTYPITLATNVPNDGSANVTMPNDASLIGITTARVMVQSVGNVFFDISNTNFSITNNVGVNEVIHLSSQVNVFPNPTTEQLQVEVPGMNSETITVKIFNSIGKEMASAEAVAAEGKTVDFNLSTFSQGIYWVEVSTVNGKAMKKVVKQ